MDDAILYWNDIALEANRVDHSNGKGEQAGPTLSSRALAIVHLAMYDAFVGAAVASGAQSPGSHYLDPADLPVAPPGTSVDTAVAAAAYTTLHALYPSQRPLFDLVYDSTYSPVGASAAGAQDGHVYGKGVADALLLKRSMDPGRSDAGYVPNPQPGKHRPDPDLPGQGFHAPFYGAGSKLFATTTRYKLADPPMVSAGPGVYRRALRQVREKGIAPEQFGNISPAQRRRTSNETLIGLYWAYDGAFGLGTPPRLYNQIARVVARKVPNSDNMPEAVNTPAQNARLFALINIAMADAGILAWEEKYRHDLWRPVLGIREHHTSMGPQGEGGNDIGDDTDPGWLPLGAPATNSVGAKNFTPPFPAYPSGHATFGAAAFHIARRFYDVDADDTGPDTLFQNAADEILTFVSEELNGISTDNKGTVRPRHEREFDDGLWQMIIENGFSRLYLGVHWSFDSFALDNQGDPKLDETVNGLPIGGVPLGLLIANDIFDNDMQAANGADPEPEVLAATALAETMDATAAINVSAIAPSLPWPLG